MSATVSGAIKSVIESGGLSIIAYRDAAPSRPDPVTGDPVVAVALPYVTVRERIGMSVDRDGAFDRGVPHTVTETVSVDLWQQWRDPATGKSGGESYDLADRLARLLHGAALPSAPTRVYGVRVAGRTRLLESEANVVHDIITLTVRREQ